MKPEKSGHKKSKAKNIIIAIAVIIGALAICVFFVYPAYIYSTTGQSLYNPDPEPDISKTTDSIDYNPENGELYVNDEIVVMVVEGTGEAQVKQLAGSYDADIDMSLGDIGFYKFRFAEKMTYDELQDILQDIQREDIVEQAYLNSVFEVGYDTFEEEFDERTPVYPDDPWNKASWDMDAPRDENWGVEAIRAPAAWGYANELVSVNMGLIDSLPYSEHEDLDVDIANSFIIDYETVEQGIAFLQSPDDHGTHVGGTIAATWNDVGVSGVAGAKAQLFFNNTFYVRDGWATPDFNDAFTYLSAIKLLVDKDVKVINISQNTNNLICFAASRGNRNAISHLQRNAKLAENGIRRIVESGKEFVICVAAGNNNDRNSYNYYRDDGQPYGYAYDAPWWNIFEVAEPGEAEAKYSNFLNLISDEVAKSRIIVVGSVGIDSAKSTDSDTRYAYSSWSNIGERVDVIGPGEDVYSSFVDGYNYMSGTSMATPHISGVAGLVFGANPELSGADVKRILLASTYGRFYYTGGYSGMIDAEAAVKNALQTRNHSVNRVVKSEASDGLDICFVVDTTGSMDDDIENVKENLANILDEITVKNENFRVALIDYRDFPDRGSSEDYASKVQLDFSGDKEVISQAVQTLELGDGGDIPETVFSAFMTAAGLEWRPDAAKVIVIFGDAPPLDPEPNTGYTLSGVMEVLYNADLKVDLETSDERVLGDSSDSLIKVYSIGADASDSAAEVFRQISEVTGGMYTGVDSAVEVSGAIIDSIEDIEIIPMNDALISFGEQYSEETVELFRDNEFLFEINADKNGNINLENMESGRYEWSIPRLMTDGSVRISEEATDARIRFNEGPWYQFAIVLWQRHRLEVLAIAAGAIAALIVILIIVRKIKISTRKRMEMQYVCSKCGRRYAIPVKFCKGCGNIVTEAKDPTNSQQKGADF